MKKKEKEKWGIWNVLALISALVILFVVIKHGKMEYQPYMQDKELKQQLEIDKFQEEYENNRTTKEQLERKMEALALEEAERQLKMDTLYVYFKSLPYGAGALDGTERDWVHYSEREGVEYKRVVAISLHETYVGRDMGYGVGHGRSIAIMKQKNVSGINLKDSERAIMNVKGYTANLKTFHTIEESIMATCKKIKNYQTWFNAYSLSEIQKKYAPESDVRSTPNGGKHGDNSVWLKGTLKHYYAIEKIENRLRMERGL